MVNDQLSVVPGLLYRVQPDTGGRRPLQTLETARERRPGRGTGPQRGRINGRWSRRRSVSRRVEWCEWELAEQVTHAAMLAQ